MSNRSQIRQILRNLHLMAAIPLGIFLYAPWRENPTFLLIMSSVVFPLLTITGLWMWQGTRLQQWLGKYSTQLPQKRD